MEGNPYKEIIDTVNEQVHRGVLPLAITGVVLTAAPLTVSAGGVVLSAASGLLVSADLLPRTRKTKLSNPETAIDVEVTGAVSGKLTVKVLAVSIGTVLRNVVVKVHSLYPNARE